MAVKQSKINNDKSATVNYFASDKDALSDMRVASLTQAFRGAMRGLEQYSESLRAQTGCYVDGDVPPTPGFVETIGCDDRIAAFQEITDEMLEEHKAHGLVAVAIDPVRIIASNSDPALIRQLGEVQKVDFFIAPNRLFETRKV